MLYRNLCPTCGGTLQKQDDKYVCDFCQGEYSTEKIENYADKITKLFDEAKIELISNARKNLYKAVTAQYISSQEVHECCLEIKKYLPDDFQAMFYNASVTATPKKVASLIKKINIKEHFESLDVILNYLIKSLKTEYVTVISVLIENAYKEVDLTKYSKYSNMLEIEAEKLDNCVYLTTYPRDVFVAYSSKDIDKALELVEILEEQGLSCFISVRNLRHGAGARENYESALQEAMNNCTSFVFVSSMNSRNQSCDALRVEIPYIKKLDFENAVGHSRSVYSSIPYELKRPRVEYRLEESNRLLAADRIVNEFFEGYERAYTPMDVAERVMRQSTPFSTESQMQAERTTSQASSDSVKYCVACLTECSANARFCHSCGENSFVNTKKEAELTKELNELRNQRQQPKQEELHTFVAADASKEQPKKENTQPQKQAVEPPKQAVEPPKQEKKLKSESVASLDRESTAGLEFKLNADGKSYTLVGKGSCTVDNIFVDQYKGMPVTCIGERAFAQLPVKSITFGDSVTTIEKNAFFWSRTLERVTFSDSIKVIGYAAFQCCKKLENVILPNKLTKIEPFAFGECDKFTSITVPDTVNSIGLGAFKKCINLNSIKLSNNIQSIEGFLFEECVNISSIVIPNGVTQIRLEAFRGCTKLRNIVIPDNVKDISKEAFKDCVNLESVVMGKGVNSISDNAFHGCKKLRVYCFGDIPKVRVSAFSSAHIFYYSASPNNAFGKHYWRYVNGVPTAW